MSSAIKHVSLIAILFTAAYFLLPSSDTADDTSAADTMQPESQSRDVKFLLKISPGNAFLPDSTPFGVVKPLQGFKRLVRAFEARHPDTRIEIVNVPIVREYLVTQLSSGAAPDVVVVNVEDVWVDVQKGWYVPLDSFLEAPNPFVVEKNQPDLPGSVQWWDMFKYQAISRGKAAPNGKNYCLSMTMVETGILYNKTMFKRLGLEPPEDWDQFLRILQKCRAEEITPLLMDLGSFSDWAKDLIFDQLYYDLLPGIDLKRDAEREAYLQGYLDPEELVFLHGKGFFTRQDPRYVQVWQIMRDLREYVNKDISSTDLTREFVTQRAAMLWSGSWLTGRLTMDRKLGFEWGVFYLPRFTKNTSQYASGEPMCVIGGSASQYEVTNSALSDTDPSLPIEERMAKSERLKRVIAFLQFYCLPENSEMVVNEFPCHLPNIVGVEPLPVLDPFAEILERRYTTTKWLFSFDLRYSYINNRMLAMYLADGIDLDEFMDWQVKNIAAASRNLLRRKNPDMDALEAEWLRLAPVRAGMKDLPPEPGRTSL